MAINSAQQASTGESPHRMVFGRELPLPVDVRLRTPVTTAPNPEAGKLSAELLQLWDRARQRILKAQARQKEAADKRRRPESFAVGDQVLLSTDNIRTVGATELQQAVKFGPRFIGPFTVERVVNRNAYRLELPPSFKLHPTVNVSRLRRYVDGGGEFVSRQDEHWKPPPVPVLDANGQREWVVKRVLAQRGPVRRRQYLVEWEGYPMWEATWEPEANLGRAKGKVRQFEREQQLADKAVESVTATNTIENKGDSVVKSVVRFE